MIKRVLVLTGFFAVMTTGSVLGAIHRIDVGNFFFSPAKTHVNPDDTVRWVLQMGVHTTTSDPSSPLQWDSGIMADSFDVVFPHAAGPGPFPYRCTVHPTTMIDTIFMDMPLSEPTVFPIILNSSQADACIGTLSSAQGLGEAILSADSTSLSFTINHDVAEAIDAHVHRALACTNGAIAFGFASAVSPISDAWSLTPTDVADLFGEGLYVNIHSTAFPAGEIRGQIGGFCCVGNRGDVNSDGLDANILDLTFLVDVIFRGGPDPNCDGEADIDGDGTPANIIDLTSLVDAIFRGGANPGACL
jgi:plastocyanin